MFHGGAEPLWPSLTRSDYFGAWTGRLVAHTRPGFETGLDDDETGGLIAEGHAGGVLVAEHADQCGNHPGIPFPR